MRVIEKFEKLEFICKLMIKINHNCYVLKLSLDIYNNVRICYSIFMEKFIKYTWMTLVFISSIGLLVNLPLDSIQRAYMDELNKIQSGPQARIDATYRYIEAIENGQEDISKGILSSPPKKYYREIPKGSVKRISRLYITNEDIHNYKNNETVEDKKYQKPLYIRDENNPEILHPVR